MGDALLTTSNDTRVEQIAAAIESYLSINPSAADSATGIAQWWLPSVGVEGALDEVEQALALLQVRHVMEGVQVGERQRFWRAATGRGEA